MALGVCNSKGFVQNIFSYTEAVSELQGVLATASVKFTGLVRRSLFPPTSYNQSLSPSVFASRT